MIRPAEVERLKDLNSPQADALVDLCRPRVLVLTKAVYGYYTSATAADTILGYQFSDGQGGSGLQRGDMLRGRVFGTYSSDSGGMDTDAILSVSVNSVVTANIMVTRPDLSGDVIAFDCDFMLRFDGGEESTINSPLKQPSTTARALMNMRFGDTSTSTWSRSQAVQDSWITATNVDGTAVNLAIPVTVRLTFEGTPGGLLTVYGGALEGL
jgi:hypothetical protein